MESHPSWFAEIAYRWCSVICENYKDLRDGVHLLCLSLEIGFRHLKLEDSWRMAGLIHTEYHYKLADIIFESEDDEAIADLLYAWTFKHTPSSSYGPLNACARHITLLLKPQPFPPRLRQVIIHSIGAIGYDGFKEVGVERFVVLLNNLHIGTEDMIQKDLWANRLLDIIQSSEATQHLSHYYWDLLVGLATAWSRWLVYPPTYNPQIMASLVDAQEWDKLECWVGVVWMVWTPEDGETMDKDLECGMRSLFHHQPGAIQKLQQWMGEWSKWVRLDVPELFRQICEEAHLEMVQQGVQ